MRKLLASTFLLSLVAAACSSTSGTSIEPSPDASDDATTCPGSPPLTCDGCCGAKYAADNCLNGAWTCRPLGVACVVCDAGTDAAPSDASSDAATCTGTPPLTCEGCCGAKYAADNCLNGAWTCPPLTGACVACDAGTDAALGDASGDAATCAGTRPNCFGNDSSACCGNDPSGPAACSNGAWMCGASPAPGCNGTSCLLRDAGPG